MTSEEAGKIQLGDRVTGYPDVRGEVIRVGSDTFTVKWEDGEEGFYKKASPPTKVQRVGPSELGLWLRTKTAGRRRGTRSNTGRRGRNDSRR